MGMVARLTPDQSYSGTSHTQRALFFPHTGRGSQEGAGFYSVSSHSHDKDLVMIWLLNDC